MFYLIGIVALVIFLFGGSKIRKKIKMKDPVYKIKMLISKLSSPQKRIESSIIEMKERAITLKTKCIELENISFKLDNEDNKKLIEKMDAEANTIAQKAKDWEKKKETILAKKEYLETKLEFCRSIKGLKSYSDLDVLSDIEKELDGLENEITAIESLDF